MLHPGCGVYVYVDLAIIAIQEESELQVAVLVWSLEAPGARESRRRSVKRVRRIVEESGDLAVFGLLSQLSRHDCKEALASNLDYLFDERQYSLPVAQGGRGAFRS